MYQDKEKSSQLAYDYATFTIYGPGFSPGMLKVLLIPDDHATLSEGCKGF